MSAAKQKGTSFETMVLNYLRLRGYTRAYRPALKGGKDAGDILGFVRRGRPAPYIRQAIFQCKNQRSFNLSEWLNETVRQAKQDEVGGNAMPILVVKRPRIGEQNLGETYAVLRLQDIVVLLQEAGYE